jgi:3-phytase
MFWSLTLALALAAAPPTARPEPRAETKPVPNAGDSADDPAIWVHPDDPGGSLILGTNKGGGLHVYDFDGAELQVIDPDSRPNNVDILYGVRVGRQRWDLAVASTRHPTRPGVAVYRIDPAARRLANVAPGGVLPVFGGKEPYGLCTYTSPRSGKAYFFVNHKSGAFEQYELAGGAGGTVGAVKVRAFAVPSQPEGCVADDEAGALYLGEEDVGVWKFPAEPDGGGTGKLIARVGENGLAADVEGLTLYCGAGGKGYLIVSSQGNNTFKVYDREGDNRFLLTIDPAAGKLGKPSDTDGVAVTNRPVGRRFPNGALVVQDGKELFGAKGNQNFKVYAWEEIARPAGLLIDTRWDPRPPR